MRRSSFQILSIFGAIICLSSTAFAQVPTNNTIDPISILFMQRALLWEPIITRYALSLFWILAGIQLTYTVLRLVIEGADGKGILAGLAHRVLMIGFFNLLLTNGPMWANMIATSMQRVSNEANSAAGGVNIPTPGALFDLGLSISWKVASNISFWSASSAVGLVIASIIIMVCFALIAAAMLVASCELYIIISAGVILLGFGGTDWTSLYALNYFRHVLASAFKLFVMNLLTGLGQGLIETWVTQVQESNGQILTMIGGSILFLCLVKEVPAVAASMIDRPVGSSDRIVAATSAAVAGYTGSAASSGFSTLKSVGSSSAQAAFLGREAVRAGRAEKATSGGSAAIGAARSLVSAFGQDVSNSLRGSPGSSLYGQNAGMLQRMSATIRESNKERSATRNEFAKDTTGGERS